MFLFLINSHIHVSIRNHIHVTRKHSSRMRTACSSPYRGSLCQGISLTETPQTETHHGQRPSEGTWDQRQKPPLEGTWDQEVASYRDPLWTEWHTRVKTLPCPKLRLRAVIMYLVMKVPTNLERIPIRYCAPHWSAESIKDGWKGTN